ncbi:hypothetical protein ES703_02612 [subsurface metagenome]
MGDPNQTRIDQYNALQWAWLTLGRTSKREARERIYKMMDKLSHLENVDFRELVKKIIEKEEEAEEP